MKCAVWNCIWNWNNSKNNLGIYSFPTDKRIRFQWLFKCGRDSLLDVSEFGVCSRHFEEDDFENSHSLHSFKQLKKGAVPHLNLIHIKQECDDSEEMPFELEPIPNFKISNSSNSNNSENPNFTVDSLDVKPDIGTINMIPGDNLSVVTQSIVSSTSVNSAPSSVPANQSWPGNYDFKLYFDDEGIPTKGATWTYSRKKDKLYVAKDVACPIRFCVNQMLSDDMKIRVQAAFTSPEYASEVVTRCMSHFHEDLQKGVKDPQHLVRCESAMASFETDNVTKHNSVVVPFENPAVGQKFSTYIYKFTCFGSCIKSPHRRHLSLIYTLEERSGNVVGRQKLDIKICACPARDRRADEKETEKDNSVRKRNHSEIFSDVSEAVNFVKDAFPTKRTKIQTNPNGIYNIRAKGKDMYDFLIQMKKMYKIHRAFQSLTQDDKKEISKMLRKKSTVDDSDSN